MTDKPIIAAVTGGTVYAKQRLDDAKRLVQDQPDGRK